MTPDSVSQFVEDLKIHGILTPEQLAEVEEWRSGFVDWPLLSSQAKLLDLNNELLEKQFLTTYQLERLTMGRVRELILGKYVLQEPLGKGGMGEVFRARHRGLNRIVAVKVIRQERMNDEVAFQRFHREIRAIAHLSHPNIVRAYDADKVDDKYYIAMEYVEGVDLSRMIRERGPLPIAETCAHMYQVTLGLQHAFERSLVHRDLKPSNLIVARGGCPVKILDMGLARLIQTDANLTTTGELTQDEAMMGTPDYMAPEQAVDSHEVDIRADLYSLGCTTYHLLTGQVPFPGGTALKKMFRHCWTESVPIEALRPDVPAQLAIVIRKLMSKQPADRYQTPLDVSRALAEFVPSGLPVVLR